MRLGLGFVAACLAISAGAVASVQTSATAGAAAHSLVRPAGYVVASRAKGGPVCTFLCYSPGQLRDAYDFPSEKKDSTGAGQTILVVVPYGSATIQADLAAFDSMFKIPAPPSFTIVTAKGAGGVGSGDLVSWGVEASAGVEWSHAMAPGANIVLAVSPTDDTSDIAETEAELLPQFPGAIVTQSFGDDETDPGAQADFQTMHAAYVAATALGGTILASSGDFGATDCPDPSLGCGDNPPVAAYPASDPLVTGVGGTEGNPYPDGLLRSHNQYGGEQVWNEGDTFGAATGGAPSVVFDAPSYQLGIPGNVGARTVPDVSYNGAINGGIAFIDSDPAVGGLGVFGGTSAGPPQWAGIIAIADQARASARQAPLGLANTALYAIAQDKKSYRQDFHDITVGTNALGPFPGFAAGPGYDIASGLGTPDVKQLVHDLVHMPGNEHPHEHDGHGPHGDGHGPHGGGHRVGPQ